MQKRGQRLDHFWDQSDFLLMVDFKSIINLNHEFFGYVNATLDNAILMINFSWFFLSTLSFKFNTLFMARVYFPPALCHWMVIAINQPPWKYVYKGTWLEKVRNWDMPNRHENSIVNSRNTNFHVSGDISTTGVIKPVRNSHLAGNRSLGELRIQRGIKNLVLIC